MLLIGLVNDCLWSCSFLSNWNVSFFFFFQAEDGIRDYKVTGVQTCALPISHIKRRATNHKPASPGSGWLAWGQIAGAVADPAIKFANTRQPARQFVVRKIHGDRKSVV